MHSPANVTQTPRDAAPAAVATAAEDAARAAAGPGVRIDLVGDVPRLERVARFLAEVWRTPESRPPFGVDVLRALVHAGGAVHCADDGTGLVGASVLTFCAPESRAVYSMIAAARTRDRGVGFAVKQAQRAWALRHGATSMLWTFDPLVSRNARFNLVKLGATAIAYETDFYGRMDDGIEGDGETDRLTAAWSLADARTEAAAAGRPLDVHGPDLAAAEIDPRRAPDGEPFVARAADGLWCRVPPDIIALRREDQTLAVRWRAAVREALDPAFRAGFVATGFSRGGWYRLTRPEQA